MEKAKASRGLPDLELKIFAALAYLSILCIIPLLLKKEEAFISSHSKQGLVIFIGQVGVFILQIALGPGIFRVGMFTLWLMSLIGIIEALRGNYVELPIVANIANKITL